MSKVCIELKNGKKMIVNLYDDLAPITVNNFLKLVDNNFYDNLVFHRVIKNFMCQGGGYYIKDNSLREKRSESIKGEFESNGFKNDLHHGLGVISMARTMVKDSASSQFFLCVANCDHLDGEYAGFGKIEDEESLNVLKELNKIPTTSVGYMQDFPRVNEDDFTIKGIYRI